MMLSGANSNWREIFQRWRQRLDLVADRSRIDSMVELALEAHHLQKLSPSGRKLVEVSGGVHFRVLQAPDRQEIVIKLPREQFFQDHGSEASAIKWISNYQRLQDIRLPLVAPSLVVKNRKLGFYIVELFGPEFLPGPIEDTCAGAGWWKQFCTGLADFNLELMDIPQFRVLDGYPFICDLSDLKPSRGYLSRIKKDKI